jgi:hypothetical protein
VPHTKSIKTQNKTPVACANWLCSFTEFSFHPKMQLDSNLGVLFNIPDSVGIGNLEIAIPTNTIKIASQQTHNATSEFRSAVG